jgi:hypothetical protein
MRKLMRCEHKLHIRQQAQCGNAAHIAVMILRRDTFKAVD